MADQSVDGLIARLAYIAPQAPGLWANELSDLSARLTHAIRSERANDPYRTHHQPPITRQPPFAVVVTNIPVRIKAEEVEGFLSHFGAVVNCRLWGQQPNFMAEVVFLKQEAAEKVIHASWQALSHEYRLLQAWWKPQTLDSNASGFSFHSGPLTAPLASPQESAPARQPAPAIAFIQVPRGQNWQFHGRQQLTIIKHGDPTFPRFNFEPQQMYPPHAMYPHHPTHPPHPTYQAPSIHTAPYPPSAPSTQATLPAFSQAKSTLPKSTQPSHLKKNKVPKDQGLSNVQPKVNTSEEQGEELKKSPPSSRSERPPDSCDEAHGGKKRKAVKMEDSSATTGIEEEVSPDMAVSRGDGGMKLRRSARKAIKPDPGAEVGLKEEDVEQTLIKKEIMDE
ncbi:hypothetical protein M409DRAFT_28591 [Zasmidium cellare ATCC 36951]|uniref:RRM domain-containing protein n=1 Tax=Zasmidium cellare ATCC 36951 TaxID=1080233 RepID=A0A6A6C1Z8_ZASCE|nr:uncharacterized protein M409DRAFT_28591 [Zasmidium cellare ATCC 36951]KAF2160985.1 hypothetical protein M409DRAFT_28591 [Zasmidium cellare ATCC 36951]